MFIFFRSFVGSFVCWFRCEPVLGFYRCSKAMPAMGMRMYIHISTMEEIWWSVGMVSKSTLKWQSHGIKNSISTRFKLRVCENGLSFFFLFTWWIRSVPRFAEFTAVNRADISSDNDDAHCLWFMCVDFTIVNDDPHYRDRHSSTHSVNPYFLRTPQQINRSSFWIHMQCKKCR